MTEQKKLEDFSSHPPPNANPNHSINIPDSGSADSATLPTHGSKVDEVVEVKRLGFFGFGYGWDLFILGFFLLGIPWLVGAAVVIAIILDSIERETCTRCLSEGADFS
ncbi:hypothetical protein TSUD_99280 [Trifolium subterraneum]|uniref:Uncharacterized protein n=1 Tax=Trifolium subterraneum TaxID=3900 RepID=A0A2Z6P1P9_TRISU|nr:hypothetical protein TSUD_99280 [Trifolium subterraneum]